MNSTACWLIQWMSNPRSGNGIRAPSNVIVFAASLRSVMCPSYAYTFLSAASRATIETVIAGGKKVELR